MTRINSQAFCGLPHRKVDIAMHSYNFLPTVVHLVSSNFEERHFLYPRAIPEVQVKANRFLERRLRRRIAAGEEDACSQLVRKHYTSIYRFLFHLCRDVHAAEDLTQETFLSGWSSAGTFVGKASIKTWLHRIAYNKFVDWYRRSRRLEIITDGSLGVEGSESLSGPLQKMLDDERERLIYKILDRLDQKLREMIVLHYFQGLSFSEMSEVLGEPVGTVKWRVHKALARLKELLESSVNHD